VLVETEQLLKRGGDAFFVVGDNHTMAGGKRVEIRTTELLAEIAGSVGFKVHEQISMEMLVPRDIFRKNAVKSEKILWLRRR
jgi:site-specific DNA-methyltransferase (cytosine-N4-specific)